MKIGLCTIAFSEKPVEYSIDLAAKLGFDGVEIWGREGHIPLDTDATRLAALRAYLREKNIEAAAYGSYVRMGVPGPREEKIGDLKRALGIAQALDARRIRIWVGNKGSASMTEEDWELAISDLKASAYEAERCGITLLMEMHDGCFTDSAKSTLRLIEEVGSKVLRANYQVSFRPGADPVMEGFRTISKYIGGVHAQNMTPKGRRALVGEGIVDYGPIIRALREAGYDGYIEIEFVRSKEETLQEEYEYLAALVR